MPVSIEELRPHLQAFDFPSLFVEGLGWDHYVTEPFVVRVNERDLHAQPHRGEGGVRRLRVRLQRRQQHPTVPCPPQDRGARLPSVPLSTSSSSPIPDRKAQVWQWVGRESGKPATCREFTFHRRRQTGDHLLQRHPSPRYSSPWTTKPSLNIALVVSDVTDRVRPVFDVEKVTKRFYERFQKGAGPTFGEVHRGHHCPGRYETGTPPSCSTA